MSYESPTPPAELPTDILDTLNEYFPDQLQYVISWARDLTVHKAREARLEEESEEDGIDDQPDDPPYDVPSKSTFRIKKIIQSRYYWQ
ncbi:hypothetical protein ACOZ4N_00170 (plasmid) [Halorientalis pallida]|uniref:hypothetical protein n=1 Tax=Halorientalis pallida TaxID=2479928 RepID=UPI003C6F1F4D